MTMLSVGRLLFGRTGAVSARGRRHAITKAFALAVGVFALVTAQGAPAMASVSGTESWTIVSRSGHPTVAVLSGVVNTVGTVVDNVVLDPVTGTFENHAIQTFRDGSLLFSDTGTATFSLDPQSCIAKAHIVASFVIDGGTGAEAGATGSGTVSGDLTFIFRHSGGGCTQIALETSGIATATGTLTIP